MSDIGLTATALDAVTSTGAGGAIDVERRKTFGLQVTATGSPTTVTVALEGTIDGTNWFTLGTWDTGGGQSSGDIVWAVDKPVLKVRANLSNLSGGTAPTVTAKVVAVR